MADGVAFSIVPFQTRDTVRLKYQERTRGPLSVSEQSSIQNASSSHSHQSENISTGTAEDQRPSRSVSCASSASTAELSLANCCTTAPIQWGSRNLIASSVSFALVLSAFIGLQSIQTTLNRRNLLGVLSLSLVYGFYFIFGFITPSIVRVLGSKYSLLFGCLCHTVYIATNFHPQLYTLIPSSILLGIGTGPIWAGQCAHIGTVAFTIASHLKDSINLHLGRSVVIFFCLYQVSHIMGNLISSLAWFQYKDRIVGNETCSINDLNIMPTRFFSMLSVFLALNIAGVIIVLLFVDHVQSQSNMKVMKNKFRRYLKDPLMELIRVSLCWKMLLLGPISLYSGIQLSFAYGSFTLHIIYQCFGIGQIGFVMIILGLFSAASSLMFTQLSQRVPQIIFGCIVVIINAFFLLFLQYYNLRPNFALVYLFAIFWGAADGIWRTLYTNLVGKLFPNEQEVAFNVFRIWMSGGLTIGFAITGIRSFGIRLWIVFAFLMLAFLMYILLEVFTSEIGKRYICRCNFDWFKGPKAPSLILEESLLSETMLDTQIGLLKANNKSTRKLYERAYFGHSYSPPPVQKVSDVSVDSNRFTTNSQMIHGVPLVTLENVPQGDKLL